MLQIKCNITLWHCGDIKMNVDQQIDGEYPQIPPPSDDWTHEPVCQHSAVAAVSDNLHSSVSCVRMVVTLSSVTSVAMPSAQNASTTLILCHSLLEVPSVAHHAGSAFMAHPGHIM